MKITLNQEKHSLRSETINGNNYIVLYLKGTKTRYILKQRIPTKEICRSLGKEIMSLGSIDTKHWFRQRANKGV